MGASVDDTNILCHPHGQVFNDQSINSDCLLNCCLLNVCGLKTKLLGPDFEQFIDKFDLIALTETKLDDLDNLNDVFENFDIICKNRKRAKRASGGVALLTKKCVTQYVHIIENVDGMSIDNDDDFLMWVKVDSKLVKNGMLLCIVYIPPQNSPYSSVEMFDILENNMLMLDDTTSCCIIGDFNARTKDSCDILYIDTHVIDIGDELARTHTDNVILLEENNIPLTRMSQDISNNGYGDRLLSLCKSMNLLIANGRCGDDKLIGNMTCDDASVVDYVICSIDTIIQISKFEVLPFCNLLSDKHCPISFAFKKPVNEIGIEVISPLTEENSRHIITRWDSQKMDEFRSGININDFIILENSLENISQMESVSQKNIDNVVAKIKSLFDESAKKCRIQRQIRHGKKKRVTKRKSWFNDKCESKRKEFFTAKNNARTNNSVANKNKLHNASKAYKKILSCEHKLYYKELNRKIKRLSSQNPKEFWKLLSSNSEKNNVPDTPNIQDFGEHFKSLNDGNVINDDLEEKLKSSVLRTDHNSILDTPIISDEIIQCIKNLKNNKAMGDDQILNEYIKSTSDYMINIYTKLFNVILSTGVIPDSWTNGVILPLFKKKGSRSNVDNYRGITIMSCLGKLFTSVINIRLTKFIENINLIGFEQAGFRKGFSTIDHIFTFKCLLDLYTSKKKKLFCAFIDYKKAFDSVDRICLWQKLINSGISSKIFNVIFNMYKHAKSHVRVHNSKSNFFSCLAGVRQGENLSPLLFAIFLHDLETFLCNKYNGLPYLKEQINDLLHDDETEMYLNLFVLLYADDTIILSETKHELQRAINGMEEYCKQNKLTINSNKSKVLVFSRGKIRNKPEIYYGNELLEVVYDYTYLGITMSYNGTFKLAIKNLYDIANRAMFELLKKGRSLLLDIDVMLKLFDSTVLPILLYGSEVWGYSNLDMVEKLHLKFCKILLGVKKSTANVMVYGELGRLPLTVNVKSRILNYWFHIVSTANVKLSCIMYKLMYNMHIRNQIEFKWVKFVEENLHHLGLSNIWTDQGCDFKLNWFKVSVKQRLQDQAIQDWHSNMFDSNKCLNYRIFKNKFGIEEYLINLPTKLKKSFTKFRCRNNMLPIESGSHYNIPRAERLCKLCMSNELGDEFHYVLVCPFF